MSYITFNPNEVVYIRGIGYATLVNCGTRNSISQKVDAPPLKKESIYFDPELFNSEPDSLGTRKSPPKSEDERPISVEKKKVEEVLPKPQGPQPQVQQSINIVQAKLDGGFMVYTSEKNLTKTIFLAVKTLLPNRRDQVIVEIQIGKTIDTLRKAIFLQLGEQISNYYNIKLFTTNPTPTQLSVHSKTLHQYLVKDNQKLVITADYAFAFKPLPAVVNCKQKITMTGATLSSTAKPLPIALPPPPPPPPLIVEILPQPQKDGQQKIQQPKKEVEAVAIPDVPPPPPIPVLLQIPVKQQVLVVQHPVYHAESNIEFSTGKKYWQIKVQKIPSDEDDLVIGICIPFSQVNITQKLEECSHVWSYCVVTGKKNFTSYDIQGNIIEDQLDNYGYIARPNDLIGVLLQLKGKNGEITFYKNSISCGLAYSFDLASLPRKGFVPFVNIGGQSQITLDSKAVMPLDSYRRK